MAKVTTGEAATGEALPVLVGQAVSRGGISITPLFPAVDPVCRYVSLGQAVAGGLEVTEVDEGGDVGELVVVNPTSDRVLLYDGEEVAGAKQDRILNVSVLVDANSSVTIPVSCIEVGRWQWESPAFRPAGRTPAPQVRRAKAEYLREAPLERGVAQSAVWDAVALKEEQHGFRSGTSKHGDLIEHERPRLAQLAAAFPLQTGQCGMVLAAGGRVVCVDAVSLPGVFAQLYPALLDGYMLDALHHIDGEPVADGAAQEFIEALGTARRTRGPAAGLGTDVRMEAPALVGSALELDGEVIQFTAFAREGDGAPRARTARIARPSRRSR